VNALFALLPELFGAFLAGVLPLEVARRSDRTRWAEGEVRCALRAVSGRVLMIGTEWSVGVARVEPGMLHFTPTTGIVGSRDVRVLKMHDAEEFDGFALRGEWASFVAQTNRGDLFVRFPSVVAVEAFDAIVADTEHQ